VIVDLAAENGGNCALTEPGTVVERYGIHIIGYMDNTEENRNIPDPRNWQGSGNRSIANMFIDLGQSINLTEEQFQAEMARRRERRQMKKNDVFIDCPLCGVPPPPVTSSDAPKPQGQF